MSIFHAYYEKYHQTAAIGNPDRSQVFPQDSDLAERQANIIAAHIIAEQTGNNLILLKDAEKKSPYVATAIRKGTIEILDNGGAVILGEYTMRLMAINTKDYTLRHYDWKPVDENEKIEGDIDFSQIEIANVHIHMIDETDEDTTKRYGILSFFADDGTGRFIQADIIKVPHMTPLLTNE